MNLISSFMNSSHKRMDKMWNEFCVESDHKKAKKLFQKFYEHLRKHIELEDTVLFPMFDNHIGFISGAGPTTIMKRDHTNILKLLLKMKMIYDSNNAKKISYIKQHLKHALDKHHQRENDIHYNLLDNFVSVNKWQKILKRIYNSPSRRTNN